MTFEPLLGRTKSVPLRRKTHREPFRDYVSSQLGHNQENKHLNNTIGHRKEVCSTFVRENVLALPTSTLSSQGLVLIIRILVTTMKIRHLKKK